MDTTPTAPDALARFLNAWNGELAGDIATKLTCDEVDAVADLLRATGHTDTAAAWIRHHADGDEPGDSHYRHPYAVLHAELDQFASGREDLEFCEEAPDGFGAGHLVLYRNGAHRRRFAITALADRPRTDPDCDVASWRWVGAETNGAGLFETLECGEIPAADVGQLLAQAEAWSLSP